MAPVWLLLRLVHQGGRLPGLCRHTAVAAQGPAHQGSRCLGF